MKKFILTCWDGDIYILEGYNSAEEITDRMTGLDWATMPNGSKVRSSDIKKIQAYEDYQFQQDQKLRHKRGQYLAGKNAEQWHEPIGGYVTDENVQPITGIIKNLPQLADKKLLTKKPR